MIFSFRNFFCIAPRLVCCFLAAGWLLRAEAMDVQSRQTLLDRVQEIQLTSEALRRTTPVTVIVPAGPVPKGGWPVLFILHGLGRNHLTLLQNPETLKLLLAQPYLVVMPDSLAGWWIDSPVAPDSRYDSMLDEIMGWVARTYPVAPAPGSWGIAGWSMGGFGAMHFAERHPGRVSFVGTIIGLLDFPRVAGLPPDQRFGVDRRIFGSDQATWDRENPSHDVAALAGKRLVIVVANQAFDWTMNENFLRAAAAGGLTPEVHHIEGKHVFASVQAGLSILLPAAAHDLAPPAGP